MSSIRYSPRTGGTGDQWEYVFCPSTKDSLNPDRAAPRIKISLASITAPRSDDHPTLSTPNSVKDPEV